MTQPQNDPHNIDPTSNAVDVAPTTLPANPDEPVSQVTTHVLDDLYGEDMKRSARGAMTRRAATLALSTLGAAGALLASQQLSPSARRVRRVERLDMSVEEHVTEQADLLRDLTQQVGTLERRLGGGLPWSGLLLIAAGYAVWRNPDTRQQLMDRAQALMGSQPRPNVTPDGPMPEAMPS